MQIVFASSEAVPYSKTGGLGDVAAALPSALAARGHDVTLVLPYHSLVWPEHRLPHPERSGPFVTADLGERRVTGQLLTSVVPENGVRLVLVDQPAYFARRGLYDGADNCERYAFFSHAVIETCRLLGLNPDVVHANDWQTGLVPALLATGARERVPNLAGTGSVFTIHNIAFQGDFPPEAMPGTGLDGRYFSWEYLEFFGRLNLLKAGVVLANEVTTVSPTYADEIRTERFGHGLDPVLRAKEDRLTGILNGVDLGTWNPTSDPMLDHHYDVDSASEGKAANKRELQTLLGLPVRDDVPLFGMISRMTDQKGFDLIRDASAALLSLDAQFCFLGTGAEEFEQLVRRLAERAPEKVAATVGFDEALAHRIEAGSDAYLMPSSFEPCGLNQMYSQVYGTVPVVHRVGGLADTVVGATEESLADGTATGVVFEHYTADGLLWAVHQTLKLFADRTTWSRLVRNGMTRDFSWAASAAKYETVYERAAAGVAEPAS